MDNAKTEADIDSILDNPERMALINGSGWPTTASITTESKCWLLQGLIFDEIIIKRLTQLGALRKGLEHLGVMDLCRQYPAQMKELFVYQHRHISGSWNTSRRDRVSLQVLLLQIEL